MATRERRIAEFNSDTDPASELQVELLCEDHNGTYLLPFPCRRVNGEWINAKTLEAVLTEVLGWRPWHS